MKRKSHIYSFKYDYEKFNNQYILFRLKNENKIFTFILDTGASVSYMDKTSCSQIKEKNNLSQSIISYNTSGNKQISNLYQIPFQFCNTLISITGIFSVLDLSCIKEKLKRNDNLQIDGFLGIDFINRFVKNIDLINKQIVLNI